MNIVNWDKVFKESDNFKTRSPTKWVFVEEFLNRDFYEKLQKSYPKFDNDWEMEDSYDKVSYRKYWKVDDKKIFSLKKMRDTVILGMILWRMHGRMIFVKNL